MKDAFSSDTYSHIQEETNFLESLMRKVPGFKGYLEMRDRREADQLVRESIAAQLEAVRLDFSGIHEELSHDIIKAIDFAEPLGRIDNGMMGLIGKIKDAPQGYSGFFDAVKVGAEDLERIYEFDAGMMTHVDLIMTSTAALRKAVDDDGDIKGNIRALDKAVKEANATFNSRNEVITEVTA